jgi:hypothetical protein
MPSENNPEVQYELFEDKNRFPGLFFLFLIYSGFI